MCSFAQLWHQEPLPRPTKFAHFTRFPSKGSFELRVPYEGHLRTVSLHPPIRIRRCSGELLWKELYRA